MEQQVNESQWEYIARLIANSQEDLEIEGKAMTKCVDNKSQWINEVCARAVGWVQLKDESWTRSNCGPPYGLIPDVTTDANALILVLRGMSEEQVEDVADRVEVEHQGLWGDVIGAPSAPAYLLLLFIHHLPELALIVAQVLEESP